MFVRLIQSLFYREAAIFRARYHGPVIAITGSVGKTSTKEAIGFIAKQQFGDRCLITPKSLNTEIGVPLTLLGFKTTPSSIVGWLGALIRGVVVAFWGTLPDCMVLELGADHPGDIAYLSRLVQPTHAVITNISESHSQFLGSLEDIRQEKLSLLQFVAMDGWIILNGDDPTMANYQVRGTQHKVLVRMGSRADYFITGAKITLEGTEGVLHHGNRTQRLRIARFGEHHLYSVLFAAAVADTLEISQSKQLAAFKAMKPLPGRGTMIAGKHGSLILDESYNAQPEAMRASLDLLAQLPAKRRVAILGDMRELKNPDPVHKEIGKKARGCADYVIAVGPLSRAYGANEWFPSSEAAIPAALRQLGPDVIVLVKGSQNTIRLEKLVKGIMKSPEQASHLLVRQEKEWAKK